MNKVFKKLDPVTGPLSRDEFAALVKAPFGEAVKAIRKHDPLFGRKPGEKIKWKVKFSRKAYEIGWATIEAETEEEAEKLAANINDDKISWDFDDCDMSEIEDISPVS